MHDFRYHKKKYILAVFSVLLLVFFIFYRQGFFENKALKSAAYWENQARIRNTDSLNIDTQEQKVTGELSSDSFIRTDPEDHRANDFSKSYSIIAGSYTNPDNAIIVARKFRDLGYNTSIISSTSRDGNKVQLVSVKTFGDHDEAVRYLREFQKDVDPAAWLYPK